MHPMSTRSAERRDRRTAGPPHPATPGSRIRSLLTPLAALVLAAACTGQPAAASPGGSASSGPPAETTGPGATAGATRTDAAGIEQVWVPAGSFMMGTDDDAIAALTAAGPPPWVLGEFPSEQPAHEVRLTSGYWIDRTEVTNAAFAAFVDAGGYETEALWSADGWTWVSRRDTRGLPKRCAGDAPDVPRRCITWFEAEAYARWRGGSLPTEAQWEYAARGPEARVYPWGDAWDPTVANVVDSESAVAVGGYPGGASWVGALDMSGNAMEWVADWLATDYYASSPADDPTGPASGSIKVEKGGWWGSNEFVARSAYRHFEDPPTYSDAHIGFRIVSP